MKQYDDAIKVYKIGHKYYNDSNNCSVVAVSICTGKAYGTALNTLAKLGRRIRQGAYPSMIMKAIELHGFNLIPYKLAKYGTVSTITKKLPSKGKFLIFVSGHVLTVRDGKVMDWTEGRRHRIRSVYQVVKDN